MIKSAVTENVCFTATQRRHVFRRRREIGRSFKQIGVFDRLVFVAHDLSAWRLGAALVAVLLLVTGLVMEAD